MSPLAAAVLTFDPGPHEYRLVASGALVPSVTQILSAVKVSVDFEALAESSAEQAERIEAARQLGTAVHVDCHAYDDDDLDWSTVDERVIPYVEAWATFRRNKGLVPVRRERIVYHPALGFCGTLDGIFQLPAGRRVLIDIKTGDPDDAGCQYQTAAYEAAYRCDHPADVIDARWGVQLTPEHEVPYRVHPYADWRDFAAFQAFLTTYHAQAVRRRAAR